MIAILAMVSIATAQHLVLVDKDCNEAGCVPGQPTRPEVHVERTPEVYLLRQVDGAWRVEGRWEAWYGHSDGHKVRRGDGRTPEGIFQVSALMAHGVDSAFGGDSILLDFPSDHDAAESRSFGIRDSGDGISIHGGPGRPTDGCVRVCDTGAPIGSHHTEAIAAIRDAVTLDDFDTPVVIVPALGDTCKGEPGSWLAPACEAALEDLVRALEAGRRPDRQAVAAALAQPLPEPVTGALVGHVRWETAPGGGTETSVTFRSVAPPPQRPSWVGEPK